MHHHHGGAHNHHHGHSHADQRADQSTRALKLALGLTASVLVAEVIGGWLSNSLALLADAGHVLTDAAALALSLFVAWFSRQPVTPQKTYGYLRWEILAAFINGATLLAISIWIVIEALLRLRAPEPVGGTLMLVIAALGLVANVAAAYVLHPLHKSSLNVHGAYLHVLGDLLASVATIVAAAMIAFTGWLPADPIASLLTTALIVRGAWRLVRESVDVLLEATPAHIALPQVRQALEGIPGVESVHDLHVWTVTSGVVALSAHAVVPVAEQHQAVLERACDLMNGLGIHHITVQVECTDMFEREQHLHP
ncbi:MAG TPA: cation diffusion facilitator family transporter [Gemmatimonadaceae bacterium]|nr:cation diffusion facilitator family transporter [Gemmatimonadaceae bacterium]